MAEFQKVMKILKRQYENMGLYDFDYARMEEDALKWAAEHPEPVYPTWGEWLITMGILYRKNPRYYYSVSTKAQTQIPPDIAQKLGIEPKEE